MNENQFRVEIAVDPEHQIYPFCLVWTSLPCLTCCVPFIGHTGIAKSDGTIYDFVGRGPMHHGQLAFGAPLKYLVLDHDQYTNEQWDQAIAKANEVFQKTDHNIIVNNCHHHVAQVLNNLKYKGKENWGQVDIALLALKGRHTGYFVMLKLQTLLVLYLHSIFPDDLPGVFLNGREKKTEQGVDPKRVRETIDLCVIKFLGFSLQLFQWAIQQ